MASDVRIKTEDMNGDMSPYVAKSYIVDMLEQLMLLAQDGNLKHIANGLDTLLEPYRD